MIVHLHIGTPKSGTTYLQRLMARNRDRLAADGVLWAGRVWADQVHAVRDVLDVHPGGQRSDEAAGAWDRFVAEVDAWEGRAAVLSMEWLVHATPAQVGYIAGSLRHHEVRVVATARDIARAVPSQWQEQMQNWATWTWEEYLDAVTSDEPFEREAGRQFHTDHDLGRIMRTWAEAVPADRMRLVTIPGRGADDALLWRRFAEAIEVDPEGYDTRVPELNESLGAASAELMRRINVTTREQGLQWRLGDPLLKWGLAKGVLSGRRGQEARLVLPAEHHEWAVLESKRHIRQVEELGIPVIGSLEELVPQPAVLAEPVVTAPEELLDAAVDGVAGLVVALAAQGEADRLAAAEAQRRAADETERLAAEVERLAAEARAAEAARTSARAKRVLARAIRRGARPVVRVARQGAARLAGAAHGPSGVWARPEVNAG
ncbi:hypothetical protein [Blastococcus sp. KM273129]|uniref:hypothetical protein n=1 Tax=Blastococcus sp. KM273129 TaxID=2570315 RepID=UPI001F3E1250|nr:hypothetical protein [Blastococcus sp. KM273129]MCF6735329.1 hypothetical protein [Blastococcus sp. KM273129]